jgi:hypothetical protein
VPARVKKNDPWIYCRNPKCDSFGVVEELKETAIKVEEPEEEKPRIPAPVPPPPKGPIEEHESVKQARIRIQKALRGNTGQERNVIGLSLALLAQELGHRDFANALIDEYELDELFGIVKTDNVSDSS